MVSVTASSRSKPVGWDGNQADGGMVCERGPAMNLISLLTRNSPRSCPPGAWGMGLWSPDCLLLEVLNHRPKPTEGVTCRWFSSHFYSQDAFLSEEPYHCGTFHELWRPPLPLVWNFPFRSRQQYQDFFRCVFHMYIWNDKVSTCRYQFQTVSDWEF